MNIKRILDVFKLIGYILLLIADEAITVRSFYSVGEFFLAGFGGVIVLIGAWVFLDGIRRKGAEKWFKLLAWGGSVILIVFLNWAFVLSSINVQSSDVTASVNLATLAADTKERQIKQALDQIDMYNKKIADLNKWQTTERDGMTKAIAEQNALIASLMKPEEKQADKKTEVKNTDVFKKMSSWLGGNQELVTNLWWLLAFLVAQLLTVLAAPKADEDQPTRRRRTRTAKAKPVEENWPELVWWFVWAHWVCVRTGKPHRLLDRASFDTFVTAHYRALTDSQYNRIAQAAASSGVTAGEEIREENEENARRRILEVLDK